MTPLREGVSTGSCAAAAAKAAALWLSTGRCPERVEVGTPLGRTLCLDVVPYFPGCCGVVKDAGDDPDATNGLTVVVRVDLPDDPPDDSGDAVEFRAGEGVGVVTLPGLKVPVGEPAINPVPRRMIAEAVREVVGPRAAVVTVSVPGGEEVAKRTFNPRLGVVGGISILGTTGVVRPMDERAIFDSLSLELNTHAAQGKRIVALTFGNTGESALRRAFGLRGRCVLQVGNCVGFVLDEAQRLGFERVLLCGHPGKLLKVAAGSFNTHNRVADGRMEALCAHAAILGAGTDFVRRLYACTTTEEAMGLTIASMEDRGAALWTQLAEAVVERCVARSFGELAAGAAFIDNDGTILGKSARADALAKELMQ
ncbi:MAG: cobalt-precorrin-5B (C(1))-methyltransferase CbiD [Synergistaceae bacterium]|jgi:cobalt-precorrin-5B (C1)-methyltransferase|nr:cobalt-precorrin-5B (C(1))-methyltransferase CbiD [Synergistaceae bacterium]